MFTIAIILLGYNLLSEIEDKIFARERASQTNKTNRHTCVECFRSIRESLYLYVCARIYLYRSHPCNGPDCYYVGNVSNVAVANVWLGLKENHASYDDRGLQNEISYF